MWFSFAPIRECCNFLSHVSVVCFFVTKFSDLEIILLSNDVNKLWSHDTWRVKWNTPTNVQARSANFYRNWFIVMKVSRVNSPQRFFLQISRFRVLVVVSCRGSIFRSERNKFLGNFSREIACFFTTFFLSNFNAPLDVELFLWLDAVFSTNVVVVPISLAIYDLYFTYLFLSNRYDSGIDFANIPNTLSSPNSSDNFQVYVVVGFSTEILHTACLQRFEWFFERDTCYTFLFPVSCALISLPGIVHDISYIFVALNIT